jgi:hypothetical protein
MSDELEINDSLFAKVLETDVANIIRKASAGHPLNARERAIIEEERDRRKNPRESVLTLEGEGPSDVALARLTQAELAERYGYSPRAIKNWISDGKKADDPCPLRRPEEMPAWFARVYAPRECPDRLLLAVQAFAVVKPAEETGPAPAPPSVAPERFEIAEGEKGLLAMLGRLREAEATLHRRYMSAVEGGREKEANWLYSEWVKTGERLRALEKTAPKALEEMGIYVRRDEVTRELVPLHKSIIKSIRQGLRQARPVLKAAETQQDWNTAVDEVVDRVCTMLVQTKFAEPLSLEAA